MPASIASVQVALDRARQLGITLDVPVIRSQRTESVQGAAVAPASEGAASRGGDGTARPSFDSLIREAASREGIDSGLLRAVAAAESNLNPQAVSPAGAKGIMQLMDGTARSLGVTDPFDPAQNIAGGAKYLKQMLTRYGGDVTRALAAYNAGPGAVDRHDGVPPYNETQVYVQRVLGLWNKG